MARTSDPDSATAQFFLNLVDNAMLDPNEQGPGYAVFGKITDGLDVIDKIAKPSHDHGQRHVRERADPDRDDHQRPPQIGAPFPP